MTKNCYIFIDASNMFYGTPGRPNWRVDYQKLFNYLTRKYQAKKIYLYSGIETYGYNVNISSTTPFPVTEVLEHLKQSRKVCKKHEGEILDKYINRAKFFKKLNSFGYILRLKPIRHIRTKDGFKLKANCDVDLTFDMMRLEKEYTSFILFSGDGDFEILLRYATEKRKKFKVFSFQAKTAYIIKKIYFREYQDISTMKEILIQK